MAFQFTDAARYPYQPGGFFLGLNARNRDVGINTERHLITVAGAGSGKGAALIIPNLRRWKGSAVVVDPKGENATLTAGDRKAMGQTVGVVDPYQIAKGEAAGLRCSINPLAVMKPGSLTIRADLEALGDGLIRRHDPRHAQWDDTAAAIVAGLADFVINTEPPEKRNLLNVRGLLLLPEENLRAVAFAMMETVTPAGLAKQAGALIQNKFSNVDGVPAAAFARAMQETGWIDDPAFASILGGDALPSFDLETLKAGTGSLYLCIPPGYLDTRGGFLRLFVRMGLMTMMSDLAGHDGGERCLFLLDEFHSLGKLDIVAKAAGLMRGYGVQLWPFLQDMGQLEALYGGEEMHTFFANADARIFFGNSDKPTLGYVSEMLGNVTAGDIGTAPLPPMRRIKSNGPGRSYGSSMDGVLKLGRAFGDMAEVAAEQDHHRASAEHDQKRQTVGRPYLPPEQIAELVGKKDGDKVAKSAVVFAKGGDVLNVRLRPYFPETVGQSAPAPLPAPASGFLPAFKDAPILWTITIGGTVVMVAGGMPVTTIIAILGGGLAVGTAIGWTARLIKKAPTPQKLLGVVPLTPPTFLIALGLGVWFYQINTSIPQFVAGLAFFAFGAIGLVGWYYRKWRGLT